MANDLVDPSNNSLIIKNSSSEQLKNAQANLEAIESMKAQEQQNELDLYELKRQNLEQIRKTQLKDLDELLKRQQEINEAAYQYQTQLIDKETAQKIAAFRKQKEKETDWDQATIDAEVQAEKAKLTKIAEARKKAVAKATGHDKRDKDAAAAEKKEAETAIKTRKKELLSTIRSNNATDEEKYAALTELKQSHSKTNNIGVLWDELKDDLKNTKDSLLDKLDSLITGLQSNINEQASLKSSIDTRLQGFSGKYWDDMSKDIIAIAGTSPLIKQADLQEKINTMVSQGIAFNVEQRATLDVMASKIATTFSATNETLTKLVRIQQQDTTAARLGMESALTSFLNSMYETSEFMQSTAATIREDLYEAEALMSSTNATSFEYQVEKWLGSLYSVGMSSSSVTSIASVLGKLASGDLSAISSGDGTGTLMIMAANNSGLSVADILNNGLTDNETNELMQSMVDYLAEIADQAGDSKVIQQQLANVYGLSASDLKAVTNLASATSTIAQSSLDYSAALQQLNYMASTMADRTSLGEKLSNLTSNATQTIARSISSNPALYAMYTAGTLLSKETESGSEFSIPLVMGTGSVQTYSVADILRYGAVGAGLMTNLIGIVSSLSNAADASNILDYLGINSGVASVTRGTSSNLATTSGVSVSDSGSYVGNSNASDITSKTMTDTTDNTTGTVSAVAEESTETTTTTIDNHIVQIYDLLYQVVDGANLRVSIEADNRFVF